MKNTAMASLALFASTVAGDYGYSATGVGSAVVVNNCNYPVKLCNVPSAGGGYEEEDTSLAPGGSWSQVYTQLSNGNGWSIKLSKTDSLDQILQFEYTSHGDGIIWYDLSCVNGNPWDHDWEITANGTQCAPKQQAYRYSTDDAYGMQSCAQDSVITVTLCTGTSADKGDTANGSAPAPSSSAAASSSAPSAPPASKAPPPPASPPSYQQPSSSSPTTAAAPTPPAYTWNNKDASKSKAPQTTPTTLATSVTTTQSNNAAGVTITEFETLYTTAEVTVYNRHRRHEHGRAQHA
ncbi:hypothetical protein CERZMDRAFT_110227 [Cercospora zeae-maydis SCOH1-5]|uniref:Uncharacterized protein n=1 Tax=Cercospora zeae-maydis SCOH1-5 TaxID=717836 RepID=A0A6A6FME0_9PEZI|nr:hypothetical protein CERZMDRAFT_110227 [Cercospora zeae-maydis SCOH1-5]